MEAKEMDFDTFMIENKKGYDAKNARIIEVADTVEYLQSEVYSASDMDFILNGKLKGVEEIISNGEGFTENHWLIDEVMNECKNLQGKELAVCEYMAANNGINRFEATRVGDWCLNTTISILRKKGINIRDEFEKVPTRWGKDSHVKRYYLVSKKHK